MSDKERLEEIAMNVEYNECGISGELLSVELKPNDYYELLERVQELEKVVKHNFKHHKYQQEMIFDLEQQNKRYREFLEDMYNHAYGLQLYPHVVDEIKKLLEESE